MATHPDTSRPNKNTLYLATSGGGKSQALMQNPAIPHCRARVILWDPSGDHAGLHYTRRADFVKALHASLTVHTAGGRGFRIAYAGEATPGLFEWFMGVCWDVLDGRHETFVIAEELSAVCESAGKATPMAAKFLNQCRKYGGIFHGTSQKPQEVAKTFTDQCQFRFIGQQKGAAMCRRMALEIGVTPEEIASLQPLEFFKDDGSANRPERIQLRYRKPQGVAWR